MKKCNQLIGNWGKEGVCGVVPRGDFQTDNVCTLSDQRDFENFHAPYRDGERGEKWKEGNGNLSTGDLGEAKHSRCPWVTIEAETNRRNY